MLARLEDVDRVGRYAGLDHRHIWHPLVMDSGGRGGHAQCHIKRHKVKQRLSNSRNDARTPGLPVATHGFPSLNTKVGVIDESGRLPRQLRLLHLVQGHSRWGSLAWQQSRPSHC